MNTAHRQSDNREILYEDSDAFMMCFASNDRQTFANTIRWNNELSEFVQEETPKVLVSMKQDLQKECLDHVTFEEIKSFKKDHKMSGCFEVSSIVG